MKEIIKKALDEISQNKDYVDFSIEQQIKVWLLQKVESQPLLLHCPLSDAESELFPKHTYKDIHYDSQKNMEYHMESMLMSIRGGAGAVPSARANMGCGIYPAWFGLIQKLYDDKMPWITEHLSKDILKDMTADDLMLTSEFQTGLDHMVYMAEIFKGTGAQIFPMDLQGPVDIAHLVYGDAFFYDLYDDADFIDHLLELSAQAILKGSKLCIDNIPNSDKYISHYNETVLPRQIGGIKISEDTPTILSEAHIKKYAMKYTNMVLEKSSGGYIHYCGKNEHLFKGAMSSFKAHGLNFGNPEMHVMEDVLRTCAQNDKIFYGKIPRKANEPWINYFTRLLGDSYKDGKFHLLLSMQCDISERESVLDNWQKAQANVRKNKKSEF